MMLFIRCVRVSYSEICEGCESNKSKILYARACTRARECLF